MIEYIDRDAVCKALNSEGYTKNMRVHKKVLNIPASDVVEVRHGRWKSRISWGCYVCSECSFENDRAYYTFCPNCGAKMDGGQDDV